MREPTGKIAYTSRRALWQLLKIACLLLWHGRVTVTGVPIKQEDNP